MKKISLITLISAISFSLFAHPGHPHGNMSETNLLGHTLWIIIPAVIFAIVYFALKKHKAVKE